MKKLLIAGAGIVGISLLSIGDNVAPSSSSPEATLPAVILPKETAVEDRKETQKTEPIRVEKLEMQEEEKCHPSYSGCLNPNASDYDCAGGSGNGPYYTGPVQVLGPDTFDLDRDGDGWGCE